MTSSFPFHEIPDCDLHCLRDLEIDDLEEVQMEEVVSLATGTLCENSSNTFLSSSFLFMPCSVFWLVHTIQLIL